MKVSSIITTKFVKNIAVAAPLLFSAPSMVNSATPLNMDKFEKAQTTQVIPVHTINNIAPTIIVNKKEVKPSIVVDKSENKLYLYDSDGYLKTSYSVGLGKPSTPTDTGLRTITGIEDYPYIDANPNTKRHKYPKDYGPKVIVIAMVDPKTGEITGYNGEFIHGTNKPESIGKNESKGCVRMNNEEVKELASQLQIGQYVLIKD